jgi:signal transduction histidine kinase
MIEDLLIISRLEECRLPLRPETVVLSGLLREVSGSFGRRAAEKSVRLTVSRRTRARVTADRSLLQRVIENILDNSLRHTPRHGRVAISMRVDDDVEIAFSNTGPAIPVSDRRRIFEKFARLDGPTVPGNAGLGLYFCKRAVEALGGAIEVRETSQWPTSFVVRLPWAAPALIETVTADVPTSDRGTIEQKKDGPRALRHGARFSRVPLSRGRRAR